jgi:hypothetical protein
MLNGGIVRGGENGITIKRSDVSGKYISWCLGGKIRNTLAYDCL